MTGFMSYFTSTFEALRNSSDFFFYIKLVLQWKGISKVEWRPTEDTSTSDPITEDEQKIAIESAMNALKTPLAVTESQYKTK